MMFDQLQTRESSLCNLSFIPFKFLTVDQLYIYIFLASICVGTFFFKVENDSLLFLHFKGYIKSLYLNLYRIMNFSSPWDTREMNKAKVSRHFHLFIYSFLLLPLSCFPVRLIFLSSQRKCKREMPSSFSGHVQILTITTTTASGNRWQIRQGCRNLVWGRQLSSTSNAWHVHFWLTLPWYWWLISELSERLKKPGMAPSAELHNSAVGTHTSPEDARHDWWQGNYPTKPRQHDIPIYRALQD